MHCFFVESPGEAGEFAALEKREHDHLFKTLRARPGETVGLLDGAGFRGTGVVRDGREVEITESEHIPEPERKLHLFCAVPKRIKFDILLKQAAELGVWSVRLIECARSVAKPEGSDRWQTLLREGCKQSGNPFLPEIVPPQPLKSTVKELTLFNSYFGAIRSEEHEIVSGGDLAWLVGPEGGFTDEEESLLREYGVRGLNLGPYILRLETAALAGLAVLRQKMTDH